MLGLASSPRATVLWGALVGLITWPGFPVVPQAGLDPSWVTALSLAAAEGLDHGTELVFTFGPLGFLQEPVGIDGLTSVTGAISPLLTRIALGWSVLRAARATLPTGGRAAADPRGRDVDAYLDRRGDDRSRSLHDHPPIRRPSLRQALDLLRDRRFRRASAADQAQRRPHRPAPGPDHSGDRGPRIGVAEPGRGGRGIRSRGGDPLDRLGQGIANVDDFIESSREVVSGYSDALALESPVVSWDRAVAAVLIGAALIATVLATRRLGRLQRIGAFALVGLVLFFGVKQGFVSPRRRPRRDLRRGSGGAVAAAGLAAPRGQGAVGRGARDDPCARTHDHRS